MTTDQISNALAATTRALSSQVTKLEVEKGLDSTGDKAVWVWVTLAQWPEFAARQQLREELAEQVRALEGVDFVYVRFQDAAELAT